MYEEGVVGEAAGDILPSFRLDRDANMAYVGGLAPGQTYNVWWYVSEADSPRYYSASQNNFRANHNGVLRVLLDVSEYKGEWEVYVGGEVYADDVALAEFSFHA